MPTTADDLDAGSCFLDTNVLLAATDPARRHHERALEVLESWPGTGTSLCASGQVVREYLAVATRPAAVNGLGLGLDEALSNVAALLGRMRLLDEDREVHRKLVELLAAVPCQGKAIHDASIVATMLRHRITRLVTANPGDFTRFGNRIRVVALADLRPVTRRRSQDNQENP